MTLKSVFNSIGHAEFVLTFFGNKYHASFVDYLVDSEGEEISETIESANFVRFSFDGGDTDEVFYLGQVVDVSGHCIEAETIDSDEATIQVFVPANLTANLAE